MRYLLVTFSCCIFIIACQQPGSKKSAAANTDSTYTITGKIDGLDSGWVYLMDRQVNAETPDSAMVISGSFTFKGKAATPQYCYIGIPNNGHKEYRLGFFVDNGQIHIAGKKDSVSDAVITGSATQDEYKSYIASRKPLNDEEENLSKLYEMASAKKDKRLTDSLEKVFDVFAKKDKSFIQNYAKQHPSSYVAALQVYQNFSYNPEVGQLDTIYKSLDSSIQNSYYGTKIKNVLDIAKKTDIGKAAPEFAQNDVNGKLLSLSSLKGKYVLVDFWASWCGPCRAENPNVVKAFQKYHAKGFDILGVSLDEKKDKWQEAIKKDNLNWNQVSDLQGWKNSVAELYGVQGIPMNFLIDKDGKIVGKGLRGEDLEKKLDELMK
jgi:peroxiredoxin